MSVVDQVVVSLEPGSHRMVTHLEIPWEGKGTPNKAPVFMASWAQPLQISNYRGRTSPRLLKNQAELSHSLPQPAPRHLLPGAISCPGPSPPGAISCPGPLLLTMMSNARLVYRLQTCFIQPRLHIYWAHFWFVAETFS